MKLMGSAITRFSILALVLPMAGGCSAQVAGGVADSGVVADGRHWVKLSTTDNLLPELEDYASDSGCKLATRSYGDGIDFGSFTVRCGADSLVVWQRDDVLSYQCRELRGESCDALMLALAPRAPRYRR